MSQKPQETIWLSIIVPVLNEDATIPQLVQALQPLRQPGIEIVFVDGGSEDHTLLLVGQLADRIISSSRGRALQMNAGAAQSSGNLLLFLHADTRPSAQSIDALRQIKGESEAWGRFNIHFDSQQQAFKWIAWSMNLRSRVTRICTGDQAIFVSRSLFESVGGYPDQPLMEDIELSKLLKRSGKFFSLTTTVSSSTRYWDKHGIVISILRMWRLRLLYFLGVDARHLHQQYYG